MSFLLDEEKSWIQRDFGLDKKILKGISKLGFIYPTVVQSNCIPIVLQGKDVLVRARTGSGKTFAFAIPILHKLLTLKTNENDSQPSIKVIILVPTKELCKQIETHITSLMYYCRDNITICSLSDDNINVQTYHLNSKPDIVVSTPARLVNALQSRAVNLSNVNTLVIDEADLILSFGYTDDVQTILSHLPKIYQGLLISATLSPELDKFKKVVLHNPAILKLNESTQSGHLLQMYLRTTEADKFLILYVFIKLGLLQGKGLIFVNSIDKCYRLKLFLQQFFISAAVLNAELPANSRIHIIEEFNRGVFDYLIATDALVDRGEEDDDDGDDGDDKDDAKESENDNNDNNNNDNEGDDEEYDFGDDNEEEEDDDDDEDNNGDEVEDDDDDEDDDDQKQDDDEQEENNESDDNDNDDDDEDKKKLKKSERFSSKKKNISKSLDLSGDGYGVSRGIDFKGVAFVINFDFPVTAAAYTHRIGRTSRGGATGTALSFVSLPPVVVSTAVASKRIARAVDVSERDEDVLRTVQNQQPRLGSDPANVGGSNVLAAIGSSTYEEDFQDERHLQPSPLVFNLRELESFRYRVEDTLRSVTSVAVKELRAAELKREILNSEQLKSYFSENPSDLKVLRHDKAVLHPIRIKEHLKHVPDYLVPPSMRSIASNRNNNKKRRHRNQEGSTQEKRRQLSKSKDPLYGGNQKSNQSEGDENGNNDNNNNNRDNSNQGRIFTTNEISRHSLSGRQKWKQAHKKGKFNPKAKKHSPLVAGSFTHTKRYK